MTPDEMKEILGQMLQVQRQQQDSQLRSQSEMTELRENLVKTEAIANSNARAIEALGNKVSDIGNKLNDLIEIVGQFAQATNTRLEILEDKSQ